MQDSPTSSKSPASASSPRKTLFLIEKEGSLSKEKEKKGFGRREERGGGKKEEGGGI